MCFILDGVVYMFLRMPFGLTTAPWAFTRVMSPVKTLFRLRGVTISSFIDDFFILAVTQELCSLHTSWTEHLLIWLGFQINYPKSSLVPLQSVEYLGILLDLRLLTHALPSDKVSHILSLSSDVSGSFDYSSEVGGAGGAPEFCPALSSSGENAHSSCHQVDEPVFFPRSQGPSLSNQSRIGEGFASLPRCQIFSNPTSFQPLVPSLELTTDASDSGWSGVIVPFRVRDFGLLGNVSNPSIGGS